MITNDFEFQSFLPILPPFYPHSTPILPIDNPVSIDHLDPRTAPVTIRLGQSRIMHQNRAIRKRILDPISSREPITLHNFVYPAPFPIPKFDHVRGLLIQMLVEKVRHDSRTAFDFHHYEWDTQLVRNINFPSLG